MITTLGFLMMLAIIGLILLRRISPVVAFTTLPVIVCLLAGFNLGQIGEFIKAGPDRRAVPVCHPVLRHHA
jgi:CitMHS family citrate-Mg2+:H+ or citrate-Ca2+:H+ symporter